MNSSVQDDMKVLRLIQRSSTASDGKSETEISPDAEGADGMVDEQVELQQLAKEVMTLLKRELRENRERRGLS